ncbi:GntR family transcriptional regulator [Adlercreutzia sp. R7]|uniref:GntR family transcriptional regulator n=1 Tax=Adlercreutzia wanghongyangiae TaxID=3111451 RepID=A0ABU6IJ06_9ACTN|nr:GntR family transcriptional regulator [Adlercreutzia sp. R7]
METMYDLANAKRDAAEPNRADTVREVPPAGREGAPTRNAQRADAAPREDADEALFAIDESSDLPLWVQLRNRLAHLIRTGYFKAGEQLPSLRSLSAEARVNYNTVTKAYRDLESSNLIVSVRGRGMYVQKSVTVDDSPENAVDAMAEQCVEEYRALGLSYRDIQRRLTDIVQAKADEAATVANEKRGYYGKTF